MEQSRRLTRFAGFGISPAASARPGSSPMYAARPPARAAERRPGLHDPSGYGPSWGYGRLARAAGLDGVHYRSVRRRGGRCLAVFQDRAARFSQVVFGAVVLEWDGSCSRRIA